MNSCVNRELARRARSSITFMASSLRCHGLRSRTHDAGARTIASHLSLSRAGDVKIAASDGRVGIWLSHRLDFRLLSDGMTMR